MVTYRRKEHATFGAIGTQPSKQTLVFSGLDDGEGADERPERGRKQDALGGGETARESKSTEA